MPILMLLRDIQELARRAFTFSEMPVVERQRVVTGGCKPLRIRINTHLLDAGQSVGEDNAGAFSRKVALEEPGRTSRPVRIKTDRFAVHRFLPPFEVFDGMAVIQKQNSLYDMLSCHIAPCIGHGGVSICIPATLSKKDHPECPKRVPKMQIAHRKS